MPTSATGSLSSGSITISANCAPHRGPRVFAPLLVEARGGEIVFDAQVTDGCQIILDEVGATALFDLLAAWLTGVGDRMSAPGGNAVPAEVPAGLITALCRSRGETGTG